MLYGGYMMCCTKAVWKMIGVARPSKTWLVAQPNVDCHGPHIADISRAPTKPRLFWQRQSASLGFLDRPGGSRHRRKRRTTNDSNDNVDSCGVEAFFFFFFFSSSLQRNGKCKKNQQFWPGRCFDASFMPTNGMHENWFSNPIIN